MKNDNLITVLIVDDEVLARVGIKSLINWEDLGFTVIGEADNGERALRFIEDFRPDLVLTDIKMPRIDGLELIKRVKGLGLPTEFIILSSYGDFAYAQEAVKLGARDYILKLEMKKESLEETLLDLKPRLLGSAGKSAGDNTGSVNKAPQDRESLLRSMIISDYSEEYNSCLKPVDGNLFCIYLRAVSLQGEIFSPDEKSALKMPLLNLLGDVLSDFPHSFLSHIRPMEFVVLYSPGSIKVLRDSKLKILELVESMLNALKQYTNLTGLVGVAGPESSMNQVNNLYKKARGSIEDTYVYPGGTFVLGFEKKPNIMELRVNYHSSLDFILHRMHQMDFSAAASHISELGSLLNGGKRVEKGVLKIICYKIADAFRSNNSKVVKESFNLINRNIDSLSSIEEFQTWLKNTEEILSHLTNESTRVSPLILKAVRLLEGHYSENLTLADVAEYLDLSPGYLSQLFKKELDKGFTDYLTDYRIKKATELLLQSDESVQKIAEKVGYENIYYFSRVFKSRTGQSPREFRKTHIENI